MKKTAIATALLLASGAANAAPVDWTGTFAMYNPVGGQLDANDGAPGVLAAVTGQIDVDAGTFSLASEDTFFGVNWSTSGGTLYGEGTYTVSTVDPAPGVSGGDYTFTVGAGQLGANIDFAWGGTTGIDVVMVWDVIDNGDGTTSYISTDWDNNGVLGAGMIDGPFGGFSANFDMTTSEVPVPAAVWLFGSGLIGLAGIARRRKAA